MNKPDKSLELPTGKFLGNAVAAFRATMESYVQEARRMWQNYGSLDREKLDENNPDDPYRNQLGGQP